MFCFSVFKQRELEMDPARVSDTVIVEGQRLYRSEQGFK